MLRVLTLFGGIQAGALQLAMTTSIQERQTAKELRSRSGEKFLLFVRGLGSFAHLDL